MSVLLGEVVHQAVLSIGKSLNFKAVVGKVSWVESRFRVEKVGVGQPLGITQGNDGRSSLSDFASFDPERCSSECHSL